MVGFLLTASAPELGEAFGTAVGTVKTDVLSYVGQALPVGLAIMGTILAITIAIRAFKRFSK